MERHVVRAANVAFENVIKCLKCASSNSNSTSWIGDSAHDNNTRLSDESLEGKMYSQSVLG